MIESLKLAQMNSSAIERTATAEYYDVRTSTANVSDPPLSTELDSIFGAASGLPAGFIGIVDDAGGATKVYVCMPMTSAWFYILATKAP